MFKTPVNIIWREFFYFFTGKSGFRAKNKKD